MSNENIIKTTAQMTAKSIIFELKKNNLLKHSQTPFQKTETLLYNYNNFKAAIKSKQKQIECIKSEGIPKKSGSIVRFSNNASYENKTEAEKADEMIKSLEDSISTTKKFIKIIDDALDSLKDDKYFEIIKFKYFKDYTYEDISSTLNIDISTVSRQKRRLINELQIKLFSDEVIYQIFN